MKLELNKDINGLQDARRLKMVLEHYTHSDITDNNTAILVRDIMGQLENFISDPAFRKFNHSLEAVETRNTDYPGGQNLIGRIYLWWRKVTGPTRREVILSNQRHELIERAERAEAMAFEAMAETAEIGRQRDEALRKLKQAGISG